MAIIEDFWALVDYEIGSANLLGLPSINTKAFSFIDIPSLLRQLPLTRQTYHPSVKQT